MKDNNSDKKKISLAMGDTYIYNLAVCTLTQADSVIRVLEPYLFASTDAEEVMAYKDTITQSLKDLSTLMELADPLVDAYDTHYSQDNEKDGEELIIRQVLLLDSTKEYSKLFNDYKSLVEGKKSINNALNSIGGIELLT
jgi:hypothetical protein